MTAISSFTIAWGNVTFETSVGHAKAWLVSWWDFSYHNVPIIPKTVSISVDLYLLGTINYKKIKSFTTHNIKYFKIYLIQPKRIFEFYTVKKSWLLLHFRYFDDASCLRLIIFMTLLWGFFMLESPFFSFKFMIDDWNWLDNTYLNASDSDIFLFLTLKWKFKCL